MRVVFRVEGEPSIGLGHVMRCIALAQRLEKSGHEVFFVMSGNSLVFCRNRANWVGKILLLPSTDNNVEPEWLHNQCIELQANWLVIDGYQFKSQYRKTLQCSDYQLAIFDDMNNSGALHADMVINGALNADVHNYPLTAPKALLAIGKKYQVLRQEFLQLTCKTWSSRESLTLMFGGSDPNNLTLQTLQSLHEYNAAEPVNMPITIITGAAYNGVKDLSGLIENSELDITHLHDCQDMAAVLANTKLALSAAGASQFELLACATPSILVVVAENQKNASQDAVSQGWCQLVNNNNDSNNVSADELVKQCLSLWLQPDVVHKMHQKALLYPVVDGANNIVDLMCAKK